MNIKTIKSIAAAALCAVGLSAFAAEPEAVQLWEGGPYFATCNVGADKPEGFGILTNFNNAAKAVTDALGGDWRLPTKDEWQALINKCGDGTWTEQKGVWGRLFRGKGAYESNSIFLPAAGYDDGEGREYDGSEGDYWSSEADGDSNALYLYLLDNDQPTMVESEGRSYCFSVRAVRDTPSVKGPSVKVDKVESAEPWDSAKGKITVNYTLGGTDAKLEYKVAFDITAGGQTASVTNDAAKLTDGAATKEIDTVALFGKQVVDTKAKVKVTLIAVKPFDYSKPVQLWEGGPLFAQCNVGADTPDGYGALYKFDNAAMAVTDALGDWRLPTKDEWDALLSNCGQGTWTEQNGVKGRLFTGKGDYASNSIFLPAAGNDYGYGFGRESAGGEGYYWSSDANGDNFAYNFYFSANATVGRSGRSLGMSVRAVRGAK